MPKNNQILIDRDAFIAWMSKGDILHDEAKKRFKDIRSKHLRPITTSLVINETATVLSNRVSQEIAREFLNLSHKLTVIHITQKLQNEALELFRLEARKGTSVTDCANVIVMRTLEIDYIFSFDKFYKRYFDEARNL